MLEGWPEETERGGWCDEAHTVALSAGLGGGGQGVRPSLVDRSRKKSHLTNEINSVIVGGRRKASDHLFWIQRQVGVPSKSIELKKHSELAGK